MKIKEGTERSNERGEARFIQAEGRKEDVLQTGKEYGSLKDASEVSSLQKGEVVLYATVFLAY